MSDFQEGTALKKPTELTKDRHIDSNNQICEGDACKLAKKNGVVWGVK